MFNVQPFSARAAGSRMSGATHKISFKYIKSSLFIYLGLSFSSILIKSRRFKRKKSSNLNLHLCLHLNLSKYNHNIRSRSNDSQTKTSRDNFNKLQVEMDKVFFPQGTVQTNNYLNYYEANEMKYF